jgi:hypothetical protein
MVSLIPQNVMEQWEGKLQAPGFLFALSFRSLPGSNQEEQETLLTPARAAKLSEGLTITFLNGEGISEG